MSIASLFERYIICEDGFGHVYDGDGKLIGWQFQLRIPYYRGVPLSLIDGLSVALDGYEVAQENIRFTTEDGTFTLKEMETMTNNYWAFGEKAKVTVLSPDGIGASISRGLFDITAHVRLRITYSPTGGYFDTKVTKRVRFDRNARLKM